MQYMPLIAPALNSIPVLLQGLAARWGAPALPNQPQLQPQPAAIGTQNNPSPAANPNVPQIPAGVIELLEQLRGPMLRYLNEGRTGYDFAELYIDWFGQEDYDRISNQPPQVILQILSSYPPLWGDLAPRQQQVLNFLQEFVSEPPDSGEGESAAPDDSQAQTNGQVLHNQVGEAIDGNTEVPGPKPVVEKKTGKRAKV
jgi:hypothetical protein